jgi:hypothetical protein
MLWITASAKITKVSALGVKSEDLVKKFSTRRDLLDQNIFNAVAERHRISKNPGDYIYTVARAVTADVPNQNGDAFPIEELLNLHPTMGCLVYQTFINDPMHVEHMSDDPMTAIGFILDSHFNQEDPKDKFVEVLSLIDKLKDPKMAKDIASGRRDSFSMGCLAETEVCSYCGKSSRDETEFCNCLKNLRMQRIGGKLVYGKCYGVTYTELSSVSNPADPKAVQRFLLAASRRLAGKSMDLPLIGRMGLSPVEAREVARYFDARMGEFPPSMVRLGEKLFSA